MIALAATSAAHALVKMIYTSLAASVAIAIIFSLAIYGLARAGELRRSNRAGAATVHAVVGYLAVAAFLALVVYGLILVAHKS